MFWDIFVRLCHAKGVSPNAVAKRAGVRSTGTVTAWKGGAVPRDGVLAAIANYFGVSTDFLLGATDESYLLWTETRLEEVKREYESEADEGKRAELALAIDTLTESISDQRAMIALSNSAKQKRIPEFVPNVTDDVVSFPVIGGVAAGYDHIVYEDWDGSNIDVPRSFLHGHRPSDCFVLRVKGDSMYPDYQDGDHVLVSRQSTMDRSGQVGVVVYGDENATLKRIEYVMGEDWMVLRPINPQFPPIRVENEDLEHCKVLGVARYVIREVKQ